jgi:hypothetical protein
VPDSDSECIATVRFKDAFERDFVNPALLLTTAALPQKSFDAASPPDVRRGFASP